LGLVSCIGKIDHNLEVNCLLHLNDSVLWGSTSKYLQVLDTKTFAHTKRIELSTGLPEAENFIGFLTLDKSGNSVWIACSSFVFQLNSQSLTQVESVKLNHERPIRCLIATESLLWSSTNSHIHIWDLKKLTCIQKIATERVYCLLSVGETIWSAGFEPKIQVWGQKSFKHLMTLDTMHTDSIRSMILGSVNKLSVWTGSFDKTISLWK